MMMLLLHFAMQMMARLLETCALAEIREWIKWICRSADLPICGSVDLRNPIRSAIPRMELSRLDDPQVESSSKAVGAIENSRLLGASIKTITNWRD